MSSPPIRLDRLRVQTARMMEIYALLQGELEKNAHLSSLPERDQLDRAIETIRANMRHLLAALTAYKNVRSRDEARELEELLDAVLEWHNAEGE